MLEKLVAPFDVVQRKRNLLNGFESHDLGDLLRLHRRKLDEPREAGLSAHAHADKAALHRVPLHEAGQRGGDELFAIIAGVGEDGFVLDDLEVIDAYAVTLAYEFHRLERAVSDIDSP